MTRRIFSLASLLSLLLCVATVVMWVRSYRYWDDLEKVWHDPSKLQTDTVYAYSNCGLLVFSYGRYSYATREWMAADLPFEWPEGPPSKIRIGSERADHRFNEGLAGSRWWNRMGFRIRETSSPFHAGENPAKAVDWKKRRWLNVPHWAMAGVFAVLPTARILWLRSRRRRKAGVCSMCSYDLTGNTSGVCPECGESTGGRGVGDRM